MSEFESFKTADQENEIFKYGFFSSIPTRCKNMEHSTNYLNIKSILISMYIGSLGSFAT